MKEIIADYLARDRRRVRRADHGFALDADEQRRRYLLQSILNAEGLDVSRYAARFGTDPADDFPDLPDVRGARAAGMRCRPLGARRRSGWSGPTRSGRGSFPAAVRALMAGYEPK